MILNDNNLPLFHCYYDPPTEGQLELSIERMVNVADSQFMKGQCTPAQYDEWCTALSRWAAKIPTVS